MTTERESTKSDKLPQITVIDDDPQTADMIGMLLEGAGYKVARFYCPLQALKDLKANPPDMVITDLVMDPFDGLEVIRELRDHQGGLLRTPVMLCSVYYTLLRTAEQQLGNYGISYMRKPFDIDVFLNTVTNSIGQTSHMPVAA